MPTGSDEADRRCTILPLLVISRFLIIQVVLSPRTGKPDCYILPTVSHRSHIVDQYVLLSALKLPNWKLGPGFRQKQQSIIIPRSRWKFLEVSSIKKRSLSHLEGFFGLVGFFSFWWKWCSLGASFIGKLKITSSNSRLLFWFLFEQNWEIMRYGLGGILYFFLFWLAILHFFGSENYLLPFPK